MAEPGTLFATADVEQMLRQSLTELWVKSPPASLPIEQSTGWNNALVAFERRMKEKLRG